MTIQKLYLFLTLICFSNIDVGAQKITIIGEALDAKISAVVVSKTKGMYYVDGLYRWDKKYYGKKIRVTGVFVLDSSVMIRKDIPVKIGEDGLPLPPRQGTDGPIRRIKNSKWSLVK